MDGQAVKTLVLAFLMIASLGNVATAAPRPACPAISPADGATLTASDPASFKFKLEWRPIDGVTTYLVEMGTTPEMAPGTRALSAELPMTHYTVGGLKPGHYYWRVSPVGTKSGGVCELTIAAAAFPNTPIVLGAVASGRPLVRGDGFYCDADGPGKTPKPFGVFFVQTIEDGADGKGSRDVLRVCTGDKWKDSFAYRFPNDLGLRGLTSKTVQAGLLLLPNGAGLVVAMVSTADGPVLACLSRRGYEGVPATKSCTGADVTVSVRDAGKGLIEVVLPDGRKEQHALATLTLP